MKFKAIWAKIEQTVNRHKILSEGFTFAGEMGKRSLALNASSISFYFVLSIIPFLILLCSQFPYTGISEDELIDAATLIAPDPAKALISTVISEAYTSRIALFSLSLITLMWASSKVVTAVIRALDAAYKQEDKRNYFVVKGNALIYTVILLIGSSAMLFLSTKEKTAEEFITSLIPSSELYGFVSKLGSRISGFIVMVLFLALLYTLFPAGKRNFFCQLPGALIAESVIAVFSALFELYHGKRGIYRTFYGSLTDFALFLAWIYFCVLLFLLGGVFNARYEDRIKAFIFRKRNKK